jgi:hypothetical protein
MSVNPSSFERAASRFDSAHREDPEIAVWQGAKISRASLYHARLVHWVEHLDPDAADPLRLAARCQHLRRWAIPRADYPDGLVGYRNWRSALTDFHLQEASSILREVGYDDASIRRVQDFLAKKNLKRDADVQLFEDAICLVFFETELAELASKHDRDRLIRILRKVRMKMSQRGWEAAQPLVRQLSPELRDLVDQASR